MRLVVSIVGKSGAGKTTLLEKLIAELKQRGLKVAVVKHTGEGFELDKPGKDSWRFTQAGSEVTVVSSAKEIAVIKRTDHDLSPQEIVRLLKWDYDLMLTEGFKGAGTLKIEVYSKEQGSELLSPRQQLLAVVTETPLPVDVPQFSPNEVKKIADVVERQLQEQQKEAEIELFVNGEFVSMKPFVKKWALDIIIAMVSNLDGVGKVKDLDISIRRRA